MSEHQEKKVIFSVNGHGIKASSDSTNAKSIDSKNEEHKKLEIEDIEIKIIIEAEGNNGNSISEIIEESDKTEFEHQSLSDKLNVYNKQKLYEEVWGKLVAQVSVVYGVSDVMTHKICKLLDIPVSSRGYWARLHAGEKIKSHPFLLRMELIK